MPEAVIDHAAVNVGGAGCEERVKADDVGRNVPLPDAAPLRLLCCVGRLLHEAGLVTRGAPAFAVATSS